MFLALGDKKFSGGGQKIKTVRQYRKEAALRDDEAIQKAVYEVEHQRFAQYPDWCKDADALYMKDKGLAYHEEEEGFKGLKGCFMMLARHELNEFRRATSNKMADGTGKVIRVYGNKQLSNECGGCFQPSFVVAKGGRAGTKNKLVQAPMDLTGDNDENKKRVRDLERLVAEQLVEINKLKKVRPALNLLIDHTVCIT